MKVEIVNNSLCYLYKDGICSRYPISLYDYDKENDTYYIIVFDINGDEVPNPYKDKLIVKHYLKQRGAVNIRLIGGVKKIKKCFRRTPEGFSKIQIECNSMEKKDYEGIKFSNIKSPRGRGNKEIARNF